MNKRASTFLSSRGNNFSSFSKRVFFMHVCLDQFSIQRRKYSELHWFCSTSLCDESRKLATLSQPIRCKPKPNHDFVTGVFPRFRQLAIFHLTCSLALQGILLFLIGHCDYYVNRKAFLTMNKRGNTHSSLLRMVQSYLTILCRLNNLPRFIIKREPNKDKKIVHVETGTKLYKHLVGEVALVFLYFVLLLV